jgi:GAF domain-containing protein
MIDFLPVDSLSKQEKYEGLIPQITALLEGEVDDLANQANFIAALKSAFNWWWVGFYFVRNNQLVLGPFQGPVACTRIGFGKGVCGTAWKLKESIIVPDVHQFPVHIACSSASLSEIVVPFFNTHNECIGVLDVDSEKLNHFDEVDEKYLTQLLKFLF